MITIKNLSFQYYKGNKKVLDDLSFEIKEGTINVLLGLNGCGKTTLIKLLAGLLDIKKGDISYDNKSLKNISIKERSKIFSYVAQKSFNSEGHFVKDYLQYSFVNVLKPYESPSEEHIKKLEQLAEKLNITHLLEKNMEHLSGGERQVVTIAAAILQDTPIILLDEPTSALDLKNQNIVLSLLKEISRDGKTIILSSHNPNHALFLNANVILLNEGKILQQGKSNEIVKVNVLGKVYGDTLCYSEELNYQEVSFKE